MIHVLESLIHFNVVNKSAVGHIAGLAGTGCRVKAGISTIMQSGPDYRLAGAATLAIGSIGFYKLFNNPAWECSALYRISLRENDGNIDPTPNERRDRSRVAGDKVLHHDC